MEKRKIGVGFVGLTPDRSWGAKTHIPALRTLLEYEIVAVANSNLESSQAAATALGIPHAWPNAVTLAQDPDVDLVTITVKVPHHKELVDAALDAKKMVFCEWPLGNGLAEAEAMASRAKQLGVRNVVGLQARCSPTVRYVRDLIRDGYVGEVLSTTLVGSGGGVSGANEIPAAHSYLADRKNGATMLTIPFGHTIDALCWCLGDFREVWASTEVGRTFKVAETGEVREKTAEDQIVLGGVLQSGVAVSAHYRAGLSRGTNLLWEINGTEGDLQITGSLGHLQLAELQLFGGRGDEKSLSRLEVPANYRKVSESLTGPALSVAEEYARFAEGTEAEDSLPDFEAAVKLHRLLDAIERSATTGERVGL